LIIVYARINSSCRLLFIKSFERWLFFHKVLSIVFLFTIAILFRHLWR